MGMNRLIVHVAHLLRSMSSAKGFLRKGSGKTLITRIVAGEYGQLVLLDLSGVWELSKAVFLFSRINGIEDCS